MASVTITIPDEIMTKLSDNCDNMFPGRPGGTTKTDWFEIKIKKYLKLVYEQNDKVTKIGAVEFDIIDL